PPGRLEAGRQPHRRREEGARAVQPEGRRRRGEGPDREGAGEDEGDARRLEALEQGAEGPAVEAGCAEEGQEGQGGMTSSRADDRRPEAKPQVEANRTSRGPASG